MQKYVLFFAQNISFANAVISKVVRVKAINTDLISWKAYGSAVKCSTAVSPEYFYMRAGNLPIINTGHLTHKPMLYFEYVSE